MCRYATTPATLIRVLKGIARDFEKRVLVSAITRASIGFNINRVFQQQSTLGRRRIYLKKYVGNELRWVAIAGVFLLLLSWRFKDDVIFFRYCSNSHLNHLINGARLCTLLLRRRSPTYAANCNTLVCTGGKGVDLKCAVVKLKGG